MGEYSAVGTSGGSDRQILLRPLWLSQLTNGTGTMSVLVVGLEVRLDHFVVRWLKCWLSNCAPDRCQCCGIGFRWQVW